MAYNTNTTEQAPITFTVESSTDSKRLTLTLPLTTLVLDLKKKALKPGNANTPVERQRLVYSGGDLKDTDILGTYTINDSHTIYLEWNDAGDLQPQGMAGQDAGGGNLGWGQGPGTQYAELYATQLGILQEMGFCDSENNIKALRHGNGNVNMAVDLLSNWSR